MSNIDIQTAEIASMSSFNLQFIVPIVHELNNYSEDTKIIIIESYGVHRIFKDKDGDKP